jgi:hypothetical protein
MTTKTQLMIDDKEYFYEDMTDEQKILVSHLTNLDQKINQAKFDLDQASVAKDAFLTRLKTSLEVPSE